jgi:hypothetical protein
MTELPVKRFIGIIGNDQLAVLNAKDIPGIFSERLASNLGHPPVQSLTIKKRFPNLAGRGVLLTYATGQGCKCQNSSDLNLETHTHPPALTSYPYAAMAEIPQAKANGDVLEAEQLFILEFIELFSTERNDARVQPCM